MRVRVGEGKEEVKEYRQLAKEAAFLLLLVQL